MYGMVKTTVYLPEDLKASLERLAAEQGRSEAELIREAIQVMVGKGTLVSPKVPLVAAGLGDPAAAERVDELLEGFGRR
jgi:predicted transcriptional regulator